MKKQVVLAISILFAAALMASNYLTETKDFEIGPKSGYNAFKIQFGDTAVKLTKKYGIPGSAVALIRNGKTDFIKVYGWADKKKKVKIDRKTEFQIASNSKTITAWGVMKLVEQGKLDLDKPVGNYLGGWKIPKSKFDSKGVTLRRLLSHTSGIRKGSYAGYDPTIKLPALKQSLAGKAPGVKKLKLVNKPGSKYAYSGYGYSLVQLAIEGAAGENFSKYMKEEILSPLGMNNSSFDADPAILEKTSKAYGVSGGEMPNYLYAEKAAAGMYTTVTDFARFVEANIRELDGKNQGHGIFNSTLFKKMLVPVRNSYGFGYIIKTLPDHTRLVYHGGTNRGWRSQFAFLPERKDGLVVLTNSENGENLHRDLMDIFTKWETGYWTGFHTKNIVMRAAVKTAGQGLIVLILAAALGLIASMIRKKRKIVFCVKQQVRKILVLRMAAVAFLIGFAVLWQVVFYTGWIYNGWTFASFMPYGFSWLTTGIFMGSVVLGTRLMFIKGQPSATIRRKSLKTSL